MKKVIFLCTVLIIGGVLIFTGCRKYRDGTLSLKNTSTGTVQQILIDNVNYGSLDPGKSKDIKLPPGEHVFEMKGISGGTGCAPASVTIVGGKTEAFQCGA